MSNIKIAIGIILLMIVCYGIGYVIGEHNTNTKWQIEQAKRWRPLIG